MRLKAKKGLTYPEDDKSLRIVRDAGGISKLTEEQMVRVRLKDVVVGEWCDDLPSECREHLIKKGAVEVVQEIVKKRRTRKEE